MAFITGDISLHVPQDYQTNDASVYTVPSATYAANTMYFLFVYGNDLADASTANCIPVATGTDLTWTQVDTHTYGGTVGNTVFRGFTSSEATEVITLTFPATQKHCRSFVVEVANADISSSGANAVINTELTNATGSTHSSTLPTITTGNLVLAHHCTQGLNVDWTTGAPSVDISTDITSLQSYLQYNISDAETSSVGLSQAISGPSISLEIGYASASVPTLSLETASTKSSSELEGTVTTSGTPADGTLYWSVKTTDTAPTNEAEFIAGTGAVSYGNQSVSVTGLQTIDTMGSDNLSPGSTYYVHYLHVNSVGESNIVTTASVTVQSQSATFTIDDATSLDPVYWCLMAGHHPYTWTILTQGDAETTNGSDVLVLDLNLVSGLTHGDPVTLLFRDDTGVPTSDTDCAWAYSTVVIS